ncbi:MAG: sugar phosphate nucleotidyltransferase [Nanoarchaeota archaeon]|nr:sugar phosphate nucleotidyltransferase [Nanoarchaeota archaeon]
MNKEKIAISIDPGLLDEIDATVDGTNLRSRSQAIEVLLKQSIKNKPISAAVMLMHEQKNLFKNVEGKPLIKHHLNFLKKNRIKDLFIISKIDVAMKNIKEQNMNINFIDEKEQRGTAAALKLVENKINNDFVVLNGDTINDFEIKKMMQMHKSGKAMCTMGLISSNKPSKFGSVVMDGSLIVNFKEKKETESNIINAGIYIFKPNVFLLLDEKTKSLEKDLFPKLAKINLLHGYFTLGKYLHLGR